MTITFCGHAKFNGNEEHKRKILTFLEEKVGELQADMYLGGYGGFDSFAYQCCKEYQKNHPQTTLFFITPYITEEYQKKRLKTEQTRYDCIIYPEIEDKPLKFAISYRNKWMVEKADYVIAYVSRHAGGAYKTYQYARKKGKPVFNLGKTED